MRTNERTNERIDGRERQTHTLENASMEREGEKIVESKVPPETPIPVYDSVG